jgi:hypothetical protein
VQDAVEDGGGQRAVVVEYLGPITAVRLSVQ